MLLQGNKDSLDRLLRSSDFIVTSELTDLYLRKDRAIVAMAMTVTVVVLALFNIVPIYIAALIGAVGMIPGQSLWMTSSLFKQELKPSRTQQIFN